MLSAVWQTGRQATQVHAIAKCKSFESLNLLRKETKIDKQFEKFMTIGKEEEKAGKYLFGHPLAGKGENHEGNKMIQSDPSLAANLAVALIFSQSLSFSKKEKET